MCYGNSEEVGFRLFPLALTSVDRLVGHHPAKSKVLVQFPGRAHAWVAGSVPHWGTYKRQLIDVSHINVSLLFLPPLPYFQKNKKTIKKIFFPWWVSGKT